MSNDQLSRVLDHLPATAMQLRLALGWTHEQVYEALVALEARGRAKFIGCTSRTDRRWGRCYAA